MAHYCTNCNFTMEKEKIPPKCPYCSSEGTLKRKESAQDLLNSVMDEMSEIDISRRDRGY